MPESDDLAMEKFQELHQAVCSYSTDVYEERRKTRRIPQFFHVGVDRFFRELYTERGSLEKRILSQLERDPSLICIAGPLGCGKTTTGQKVMRLFRRAHQDHAFANRFDLRARSRNGKILNDKLEPIESPDELVAALEREILNKYLDSLFDYYTDDTYTGDLDEEQRLEKRRLWSRLGGRNPLLALYAYLLDPALDNSRPKYLFETFAAIRNECKMYIRAFRRSANNREKASYYDWLFDICEKKSNYQQIAKALEERLRVQHVIYAATELYQLDFQLIWFDNADALTGEAQREIFGILRRLQLTISEFARVLVSIRAENIRKYDILEKGAPPAFDFTLLDPIDPNGKVPGLRIVPAPTEELEKIVRKRLQFTWEFQQKRIKEIEERIATPLTGDEENGPELQRLRSRYGRPLSKEEFEGLRALSNIALDVLDRQNAIYMVNGSIRDFLSLHREFTRSLGTQLRKLDLAKAARLQSEEMRWFLGTLFLRFSRGVINHFQVGVYDIVQAADDWFRKGEVGVGCFLQHLLITATWNLEMERELAEERRRYPTVGQVLSRLRLLGYDDESVVKGVMFELYEHDGEAGHIIDFHTVGPVSSPQHISNDMHCFVTYRAQCLCSSTCNSFGYFFECVDRLTGGGQHASGLPLTFDAAEKIFPFLCDIAEMHLKELDHLRKSEYFRDYGHLWLDEYRRLFGIRLDRRFNVTETDFVHHGVSMAMLFEALIASLEAYIRRHTTAFPKIENLRRYYNEALADLAAGGEVNKDFRSRFDLPPRS
jgi:hypothetical protein